MSAPRRIEGRPDGETFSADDLGIPNEEARCAICGKLIVAPLSPDNRVGRGWVCEECAKALRAAPLKTDAVMPPPKTYTAEGLKAARAKLYETIKENMGVLEIPQWWLDQLERYMREDTRKNYSNLWYTIYYAVQIEGFRPNPEYGLAFVLWYFDKAGEFLRKRKEVLAYNEKHGYDSRTVTVQIEPPKPRAKKLTKIEDL